MCQHRTAPYNFWPRGFQTSQTIAFPALPLRSSVHLTAKELCPRCCSAFSFAQLSLRSQNKPPLGESEVSQRKRNLENLVQGAPCTYVASYEMWLYGFLQRPNIHKRVKAKRATKVTILWGWYLSCSSRKYLSTLWGHLQDWNQQEQEVADNRMQNMAWSCTMASRDCCPLGLGMVAPGWGRQWAYFCLAVGYC